MSFYVARMMSTYTEEYKPYVITSLNGKDAFELQKACRNVRNRLI